MGQQGGEGLVNPVTPPPLYPLLSHYSPYQIMQILSCLIQCNITYRLRNFNYLCMNNEIRIEAKVLKMLIQVNRRLFMPSIVWKGNKVQPSVHI